MNVLITGASGFIGLNLLERFLSTGHTVKALSIEQIPDRAREAFRTLPGRLEVTVGDVRDSTIVEALLHSGEVEGIVAAAAITAGTARERESPGAIFDVNLLAVVRLLELADKHRARRFVALSSTAAMGDGVFGSRPLGEDDQPAPTTFYGLTKASLEAVARRWTQIATNAPRMVVARLAAAFGPWERVTSVRDAVSPFHSMACAAVNSVAIAPLPQGGERDWAYAPFAAAALEWMLTAPQLEHSLYNVGAGNTWHPRQFAPALNACGLPLDFRPNASQIKFHDDMARTRTCLDMRRLAREYDSPPAPGDAVASYARWVAENADWFR